MGTKLHIKNIGLKTSLEMALKSPITRYPCVSVEQWLDTPLTAMQYVTYFRFGYDVMLCCHMTNCELLR